MIIVNDDRKVVIHYGVKGMRWGVRKEQAPSGRQLRERAKNVVKVHGQDSKRTGADVNDAYWMQKSVSNKMFTTLVSAGLTTYVGAMLTNMVGGRPLTPQVLAQIAKKAVARAALAAVVQEGRGRSSLKRYKDSGERDTSKKQYKRFTPEAAIGTSVMLGAWIGPTVARVGQASYRVAQNHRARNQDAAQAVQQAVWDKQWRTVYSQGNMSVLEKIK